MPTWVTKPLDSIIGVDESATIQCHAEGMPRPRVQWFINGKPINGNNVVNFIKDFKYK